MAHGHRGSVVENERVGVLVMRDYMNSGVNEMVMVDGENVNAAQHCRELEAEIADLRKRWDNLIINVVDGEKARADKQKMVTAMRLVQDKVEELRGEIAMLEMEQE